MPIERLQKLAFQQKLDGIIATSFENVRYLTGATIYTQIHVPQRLAALIVSAPVGRPTFVVCTIEESLADEETNIEDLRGYEEFKESPLVVIADIVRERGMAKSRIGVEMRTLSSSDLNMLQELLPNVTFEAMDLVLDRMRMIKSPKEIKLLSDIAIATDKSIRHAFETTHVGATEIELLHAVTNDLVMYGADSLPFLILGAGPNAGHAHPSAGERMLSVGDIIRCDIVGRWGGYHSDIARTAVVGKATLQQAEMYKKLREVQEEVIDAAKPGIQVSDLYWKCMSSFAQRGIHKSLPHIGHSLGLVLHECPMICPSDHTELQEGMVLAIEPIIFEDASIYHIEDLIEITADSSRVLSRSADWNELLVLV